MNEKINAEEVFKGDAFENRAQFADQLEAIAKTYAEENCCVINLYEKWGEGKTWFLERWVQRLEAKNACVVYFDAFKHDLHEEPFMSLISVLISLVEKHKSFCSTKTIASLQNAAKRALHHIIFNSLELLSKGIITADNLEKINDEYMSQTCNKIFDIELENYRKKNTDFEELKKSLTNVTKEIKKTTESPLFFIIDELDRCRPSYALEILEKIKHFFDVPHMIFVLSMN